MRGTRDGSESEGQGVGLIPTYAGNTTLTVTTSLRTRAHPHVCGEHRETSSVEGFGMGSSPRMRGTLGDACELFPFLGLIPTYAGNTMKGQEAWHSQWAHPHVCGEHKVAFANNEQVQGSSPRMRGTHVLSRAADDLHGLIPTYAGNTGCLGCLCLLSGAHPHVCGEHQLKVLLH